MSKPNGSIISLDELLKKQEEWCEEANCDACPYNILNPDPYTPSTECTTVFVYEYMKDALMKEGLK